MVADGTLRLRIKPEGVAETKAAVGDLRSQFRGLESEVNKAGGGMASLRSIASGLAGVFATLGAASLFRTIISETSQAEDAFARLQVVVRNVGEEAAGSAADLAAMASRIQETTRFTDEAVQGAQATLLRFENLRGAVFQRVLQVSVDAAAATGRDLESVAQGLGRSLEIPGEAMRTLAQLGVVLTKEENKRIDAMVAAGDAARAQGEMLAALEARYKGAAVAAGQTLGGALDRARNQLGELAEVAGAQVSPVLQAFVEKLLASRDGAQSMAEAAGQLLANALRVLGDIVLFLVDNFDTLKAIFEAWVAVRAIEYALGLAKALQGLAAAEALAEAGALRLSAALLASPWTAVAAAIGIAVFALQRYIDLTNAASAATLASLQPTQNARDAIEELWTTQVALTQARLDDIAAQRLALAEQVISTQSQINQLRALGEEERRIGESKVLTTGLTDKEAESLRDLEGANRSARQTMGALDDALEAYAEKGLRAADVSNQHGAGLGEVSKKAKALAEQYDKDKVALELAINFQQQLSGAYESGEDATARLTREHELLSYSLEVVDKYGLKLGGTLVALKYQEQQLGIEVDSTKARYLASLEGMRQNREAEAALVDARAGNTNASQLLAARLQKEDELLAKGVDLATAQAQALVESAVARKLAEIATQAHARAIEADRESTLQLRAAQADLRDAQAGNTEASRANALQLEIENALRQQSGSLTLLEVATIMQLIAARRGEIQALEQQSALERELQNIRQGASRERAEFADFREQAAAARIYGSEIAGILAQYGLLGRAAQDLEVHERAIAIAREKGGDVAAIEARLRAELRVTDEIRRQRAEYELMQLVWQPFVEAGQNALREIQSAAVDFIMGQKVDWEQLGKSILRSLINAALEAFATWLKFEILKRAEIGKTAAIQAAANKASGSNSGGMPSSQDWYQWATGGATATTTSSGGGAAAGAGTAAAIAIWAVILYNLIKGFTDKGFSEGSATIRGGSGTNGDIGGVGAQAGNNRRLMDIASRHLAEMIDQVVKLSKDWGLGLVALSDASVSIGKNSEGLYFVRTAMDSVGRAFKTAEEAIDYAKVQALKFAKFSDDTSALVQAVIHNTRALTTEELGRQVDVARTIDSFSASKFQNDLHASIKEIDRLRDEISRLVPPSQELTDAFANLNAEEARRWQSSRDAITGRQRTAAEELEDLHRRAGMWNAERALRVAELQMKRAELEIARANLLARGAIVRGEIEVGRTDIDVQVDYLKAKAELLKTEATMYDRLLASIDANIAAIDATLASLPPPIDPGEVRRPRGAGGGRQESPLQQALDEHRNQQRDAGLSDFGRRAAEINSKWDDLTRGIKDHDRALADAARTRDRAIAAAHHNADAILRANEAYERATRQIERNSQALAEANRARQEELAALAVEARQGARQFIDGSKPGGELSAQLAATQSEADGLIQGLRDLAKAGAMGRGEMRKLADEIRNAAHARQETAVRGAADSLFSDLFSLLGMDKEAAELKYQLTVAELQIRRQELEIAAKTYNIMGINFAELDKLIGEVIKAGPGLFEGGSGGDAGNSGPVTDGNLSAEALRRQEEAARTFAQAVEDWRRSAQSLQEGLNSLLLDPSISALSPQEQLAEARRQYEEIAARAQAGDVEARNQFSGAARQYLEILRGFTGGGEVFSQMSGGVYDLWRQLINAPFVQGNVVAPNFGAPQPLAPVAYPVPLAPPAPAVTGSGSETTEMRDLLRRLVAVVEADAREEASARPRNRAALEEIRTNTGEGSDDLGRLITLLERRLAA